ncbi:MAG: hypothetical protein IRZ23_08545 [Acetobacteraceae bacterium]|nr:hypothetical protein [Acetobacteraceae bacterium]
MSGHLAATGGKKQLAVLMGPVSSRYNSRPKGHQEMLGSSHSPEQGHAESNNDPRVEGEAARWKAVRGVLHCIEAVYYENPVLAGIDDLTPGALEDKTKTDPT